MSPLDDQERREQIAAQYGIPVERVTICPPGRQLTQWEVLDHPVVQALALRPAAEEAAQRRKEREIATRHRRHREARMEQLAAFVGSREEWAAEGARLGLTLHQICEVTEMPESTVSSLIARARDGRRLAPGTGNKIIDRAKARALAAQGMTAKEAAVEMNCSSDRLNSIARQEGFHFARPAACGKPWTPDEYAALRQMLDAKMSLAECAVRLGRSRHSVKHAVRNAR